MRSMSTFIISVANGESLGIKGVFSSIAKRYSGEF